MLCMLATTSVAVTKVSDINNLKEEKLLGAHIFRGFSQSMVGWLCYFESDTRKNIMERGCVRRKLLSSIMIGDRQT